MSPRTLVLLEVAGEAMVHETEAQSTLVTSVITERTQTARSLVPASLTTTSSVTTVLDVEVRPLMYF